MEEKLEAAGIQIVQSLTAKWVPDKNELVKCFEFGKSFAKRIAK